MNNQVIDIYMYTFKWASSLLLVAIRSGLPFFLKNYLKLIYLIIIVS